MHRFYSCRSQKRKKILTTWLTLLLLGTTSVKSARKYVAERTPAGKLFFLSTVFLFSTVIGTLFFIRKCLFVELRHRMIKSCLFLVRNCLLSEFDSIVGSKLIYQSVWRTLRMKRQTVSSDMKSKRMIKNEGPLKSALICQILASLIHFFKV